MNKNKFKCVAMFVLLNKEFNEMNDFVSKQTGLPKDVMMDVTNQYIPLWKMEKNPINAIGFRPFNDTDKIYILYGEDPETGSFIDASLEEVFRKASSILYNELIERIEQTYNLIGSSGLSEELVSTELKKVDEVNDFLINLRSENQEMF